MLWRKKKIAMVLYLSQVPAIAGTKFQKWSLMHMKSLAQVTQPLCPVVAIVRNLDKDTDLLWILPVTTHISHCI